MWHPHPHISSSIDGCGNCMLNISERVVQQHFVVTDVNAGRHVRLTTGAPSDRPRQSRDLARSRVLAAFMRYSLSKSDYFAAGKFTRAHAANLVGCAPAILFASAIRSDESEPKYV